MIVRFDIQGIPGSPAGGGASTGAAPDLPPSPEGRRVLINAGASEAGSHEVANWLFCPRWWALNKFGSFAGLAHEPFIRGGITHTGVGHHYLRWAIRRQGQISHNGTVYKDPDAFYSPMEAMRLAVEVLPKHEQKIGHEVLPRCQETLAKYFERAAIKDGFRVLAAEEEHRIDLPDGLFHTARVDLEVLESDGIWIEDHKTTEMTVERATRLYRGSLQLLTLHQFGRQKYGDRFRGVRINLILMGSGKSERVPINAPMLSADMLPMIHRARLEIRKARQEFGENVRKYPPNGTASGCIEAALGSQCDAFRRICAFGE